jgi:hypothetical protein
MSVIYMEPAAGWESFTQNDELEFFLWDTLKLKESKEGDWSYMSFTSVSSIWELVINNNIVATVVLECGDDEQVVALSISLGGKILIGNLYLNQLITGLKNNFNIVPVERQDS